MKKNRFNGQFFTFGNRKLPNNTAIFNLEPSTFCSSRKLGYCQLDNMPSDLLDRKYYSGLCYALKAERLYPGILAYRVRQSVFFENCTSTSFVNQLISDAGTNIDYIKYLRLNESGDIGNVNNFFKLIDISNKLYRYGIVTYLYTARKDIYNIVKKYDFRNLVVNGSGFMADNQFQIISANKLKEIKQKNTLVCKGNCRLCHLCTIKTNRIIYNIIH